MVANDSVAKPEYLNPPKISRLRIIPPARNCLALGESTFFWMAIEQRKLAKIDPMSQNR